MRLTVGMSPDESPVFVAGGLCDGQVRLGEKFARVSRRRRNASVVTARPPPTRCGRAAVVLSKPVTGSSYFDTKAVTSIGTLTSRRPSLR